MNWLKVLTQGGRRKLARELLEKYITPAQLSAWAANGVNSLLSKIEDKDKLARIATTVNCSADLAADLAAAVRDGHVDADEAANIAARASTLTGELCSQESISALIDKAVQYVP